MADITLSPQEVQNINAQQKGINAISEEEAPTNTKLVMPAKQLDLTPDANNEVSLQDQIAQSSQTSVAFSPRQLEQLKSLMGQPQQPLQQEAPPPSDPNGLPNIEELDLNKQASFPNDPQTTETPSTFEIPDDENAKRFKESFEKYLGFPLEDLKTYSQQFQQQQQELEQIRATTYYNNSVKTLAQEWGVDINVAEGRLNEVQQRFAQYGQDMQNRLDNLEGAKLIWSRLELERNQRGQVPQFQRSSGMSQIGTANDYMFTETQLDSMSKEEYEKNADRIYQAYAQGLVRQS